MHITNIKGFVSLLLVTTMITMLFVQSTVFAGYQPQATNRNIMNPTDDPIYYYESPWKEDGTFDYYYYPIYDDPMYISDEDFFGVWDESENAWSTYPYFRYTEYPEMSAVADAAKAGDYDQAKVEMLNYYKKMKSSRVPEKGTISDTGWEKYAIYLEAMARNTYPNGFISGDEINFFKVGNEWETVSVDALRTLKVAAGGYALFNVMISSVDKYYTEAEIYSKDADKEEYRPVLVAKVNGVTIECPAVKDATIRAGAFSNTNYGSDPVLTVAEHGTYMSYDDKTKRSFIAFDISAISSTDDITSAMIQLRCRTDAPRGEKELSLHWYKNESWIEDEVNWDFFTDQLWFSCNDMEAWDYVSSNTPSIKGKVCGYHRDSEPSNLFNAYAHGGYEDERYAYNYIRHIMALINGIGCSTDVMNSLDMSTHVSSLTQAMYYCINSKYMTADRFTAMLKHCWLLSNWQVNSYFGTATNNWGTFASGSVYNLIARYPELAVHDDWFERSKFENSRILGHGTFEDGMCIELSINYIQTILGTYATPIATARATGEAVPFDDDLYQCIYDTVKTLMNVQGPYSGFNQADGYDTYGDSSGNFRTWYNYGLFDDPQLTYLATGGASGKMPDNPTTHYPVGMKTFMRSGWGKNDLMLAFINNVKTNASHGHNDALSFAMFAYGKCLLTDQGYGSLQTGDSWAYMKSPVQHNTMTVNDIEDWLTEGTVNSSKTLGRGDGLELGFEANMQYDFTEYATELYTTTQISQRSITFVRDNNFWIVTDYAIPNDPEQENLFAQHWHLYPGARFTVDSENHTIRSNFQGDANVKLVPIEYDEIDEVRRVGTWYSEAAGQMQTSEKGMVMKSQTGQGRFTTLVLPMRAGEDIEVETSVIDTGLDKDLVNAAYFRIVDPETNLPDYYYFYHLNDETQRAEASLGEFKTDATTLLVQKNSSGNIKSVFIMGGTYLKSSKLENEYIIKSETDIKSLSYKKTGASLTLASTTMTDEDFDNITIYSDGATSVYNLTTENTLDSNKKGGYLYFGDDPILDVEDPDTPGGGGGDASSDRNQGVNGSGGAGSAGGMGGTGNSGTIGTPGGIVTPPVDNPSQSSSLYDDITKDDWYYEDVKTLTESGVVSGDGTGCFHPQENVTREQFLKMLLISSDIEIDEAENTFTDISDDDWFKPYVLTAKNAGIVNGINETLFGVGENITRQDMAVMINRILENSGIEPETVTSEAFADADMVSDYAADAVARMKAIGLIHGYDNEYRPLDSLTRAEAATVISNLMKIIKTDDVDEE